MASTEKIIWDAVAGLLSGAAMVLHGRDVSVTTLIPREAFGQRRMPLVHVERPRPQSNDRFDSVSDREVYRLTVGLIDSCKPTPEGEDECEERLGELRELVHEALWSEPTLGLAALAVIPPFWEFRQISDEPDAIGNNLLIHECELIVPVIVRRPSNV